MSKQDLFAWIDEKEDFLRDIAHKIWEKPEVGLVEEYASELQQNALRDAGFQITTGVGEEPTAFVAEYGSGRPILGILGEYDALPGLSQKVCAERDPVKKGAPGHGCGHNLLGTAGVGAALALKEAIDSKEVSGTVRYYGCPAEETLVGKVFMARDGVFDDLDACLTWHPMSSNNVWAASSLAMNSVAFHFTGTPAHAAAAPHMGRGALDGVELMNVAANYMREHMIDQARIHYSITDGGGEPNIVPPTASVWYYIRSPERDEVEELFERLKKIAEGATLMTETEVEWEFLAACYNTLPNDALGEVILDNLKEAGPPDYTDEDIAFAQELVGTFSKGQKRSVMKGLNAPDEIIKKDLHDEIAETFDKGHVLPGSTDVGDVSWIVPLAQFTTPTWPVGTASHSWQATAASGSGIGYKGMKLAAKTLAGALYDLFQDESKIKAAWEEFEEATKDRKYETPLPEGAKPPFHQLEH